MVRWRFLEKAGEAAEFPDLPFRAHLTEWLMDVGPIMQGGMGAAAVPHGELQAWAANIGLTFEGAEAEWLHKMSAAYAAEVANADGKDTPQPFKE